MWKHVPLSSPTYVIKEQPGAAYGLNDLCLLAARLAKEVVLAAPMAPWQSMLRSANTHVNRPMLSVVSLVMARRRAPARARGALMTWVSHCHVIISSGTLSDVDARPILSYGALVRYVIHLISV